MLGPFSFAKKRAVTTKAVVGYKETNVSALKILSRVATLMTSSYLDNINEPTGTCINLDCPLLLVRTCTSSKGTCKVGTLLASVPGVSDLECFVGRKLCQPTCYSLAQLRLVRSDSW